jgi:hypothetical protein
LQEHPGDDKFINRPIKHYTEMEIVCCNDHIVELETSKATYDPCEASSPDANLDGDDIGVDEDDAPLLTNFDGDCDDDDDSDAVGDGNCNGDNEITSRRSRNKKKLGQTEENIVNHVRLFFFVILIAKAPAFKIFGIRSRYFEVINNQSYLCKYCSNNFGV